ncbi:MAG: hypothetical protein ACLU0V_10565, partial [Eggerthella lenta]
PHMRIVVFGRNGYKLNDFTFVDKTHLTYEVGEGFAVDHAFECCGGDGSASAIDQIIDVIKPEGTVSLLGVSETPIPVNTRMVLEKACVCSEAAEAVDRTSSTLSRCTRFIPRYWAIFRLLWGLSSKSIRRLALRKRSKRMRAKAWAKPL